MNNALPLEIKGSALFIKTQLQHTHQVKTMITKHKDSLIVIKHTN